MLASFICMPPTPGTGLSRLNCGQVGEHGVVSFEAITHVLRPAENLKRAARTVAAARYLSPDFIRHRSHRPVYRSFLSGSPTSIGPLVRSVERASCHPGKGERGVCCLAATSPSTTLRRSRQMEHDACLTNACCHRQFCFGCALFHGQNADETKRGVMSCLWWKRQPS